MTNVLNILLSKEEGKDQEYIQSRTTSYPGHHMAKLGPNKHGLVTYIQVNVYWKYVVVAQR